MTFENVYCLGSPRISQIPFRAHAIACRRPGPILQACGIRPVQTATAGDVSVCRKDDFAIDIELAL